MLKLKYQTEKKFSPQHLPNNIATSFVIVVKFITLYCRGSLGNKLKWGKLEYEFSESPGHHWGSH